MAVAVGLRVLAIAAIGAVIGWIFGRPWGGVAALFALYIGSQLVKLLRLESWLRVRDMANPPELGGVWDDVVAHVIRLDRRRRHHKQRLTRLVRELRRSTAVMPDGVVVLNAEHEIAWFNRTAGRLLGLRRNADRGLRIDNLVRHPEFVSYLAAGQYANPIVIRPSGMRDDHLSMQAVPYGEGQTLLLVRDVSSQMRLEAMRKDFVANASHELRSPLTVISGYLETLSQDPELDAELKDPMAEMRRQAERMTAIVRDLLELSRLERTDEQVEGAPIDVAALLTMLRKDVLARPEHPHEVHVRIDSPALLKGEQAEIHSAFFNLVDNAAKYTSPNGSVEMRWWTDEDGGHFAVTDTGPGIPAEHIPRLTERFYRVDPGRSRATGGSGLGLAIVKHILQRHGGTLEIRSALGKGSSFVCHFGPERVLPSPSQKTVANLSRSA